MVLTEGRNRNNYVMDIDGRNRIQPTDNPAVDMQPAWSSDSDKIAFVSNRDGNFEIYVMKADGSQQVRLTNSPMDGSFPTWCVTKGT